MTDIEMLRDAASNIDWSARHLRLWLPTIEDGNTKEVISNAVFKINNAVESLFEEANALESWPEEEEGA